MDRLPSGKADTYPGFSALQEPHINGFSFHSKALKSGMVFLGEICCR